MVNANIVYFTVIMDKFSSSSPLCDTLLAFFFQERVTQDQIPLADHITKLLFALPKEQIATNILR